MSVEALLDYKPNEIVMVLLPVFVLLAVFEILAIYIFKFKTKNDTKEWFLNIFLVNVGINSFLSYNEYQLKSFGMLRENL